MKTYWIFLLLMATSLSARAQAQNPTVAMCGVDFEQLPCDLLRYPYVNATSRPEIVIGVAVHIVRYDDGTGGYTGDVAAIINTVTQKFTGSRMRFVLDFLQTINSSYFATIEWNNLVKEDQLAETYNVPNRINMYIIPSYYANGSGTFTPDVMQSLGRLQQSIIILRDAAETSTVPHEFGHYFNLLHTFERACGSDTPVPGNCTQGQNAATMGDLVSDTPPDPWPGEYWSGCSFTGAPNWCPSPYNLMSYALACRNAFTQVQMNRARTTLELKRPELHNGIALTVDQQLQTGPTVGTVGRWYGFLGQFRSLPALPWQIVTQVNAREVLRGQQDIVSLQKYRVWERNQAAQLDTVQNHRGFTIRSDDNNLTSRFHPTHPTVTIKTDLLDAPGTTGGDIHFKDPWLVDTTDSRFYEHPYGYRNLGMNAPFKPESSPFYPTLESKFKGVFLNQDYNDPGAPYYSVGAPNPNTIGGFTAYFQNWTGSAAEVQYQYPNALQTGVVFKTANATAVARYKAFFGTSSSAALTPSSQRKIIRDAYSGYLFACYESAGHIWLSRSTNNGVTWSPEKQVSPDLFGFTHRSPAIARNFLQINNKLLIAWEAVRYSGTTYTNRVFVKQIDPQAFATVEDKYQFDVVSPYNISTNPQLSASFDTSRNATLLAWYDPNAGGIKGRVVDYWNAQAVIAPGGTSSFVLVPNDFNYPLWGNPTWDFAWSTGETIYRGYCTMPDPNTLRFEYQWAFQEGGSGIHSLTMVRADNRWGVAWIDNGTPLGPGMGSSASVRYKEYTNGPVSVWPDVWGSVASPSLSYIGPTQRTILVWEGGGAARHATRVGTGSWSAVSTIASGQTPSVSVRTPGNLGSAWSSEWLLLRGTTGPVYPIARIELNYGDGEKPLSGNEQSSPQMDPLIDTSSYEGRGAFFRFANGFMHVVVLSAKLNGTAVHFVPVRDTSIVRRTQLDSALTTLAFAGQGMLQLEMLYRSRGTVPTTAALQFQLRDAVSGAVLHKLQALRGLADTVMTLRVPLGFAGRSVTLGLFSSAISGVRSRQLERWYVPEEVPSAPASASPASAPILQGLPRQFALHPNHPNPFNPTTTIRYDLPEDSHVSLIIYDVLGRKVAEVINEVQGAGFKSVTWDASAVASGVYLARFTAIDENGSVKLSKTMKLVLAK